MAGADVVEAWTMYVLFSLEVPPQLNDTEESKIEVKCKIMQCLQDMYSIAIVLLETNIMCTGFLGTTFSCTSGTGTGECMHACAHVSGCRRRRFPLRHGVSCAQYYYIKE